MEYSVNMKYTAIRHGMISREQTLHLLRIPFTLLAFVTLFSSVTFAQPTITSFSPLSGIAGTPVTITGTNFSITPASNTVSFNGTMATVLTSTATSISTTVPVGATTGTIAVTVSAQTATSATAFYVALSQAIMSNTLVQACEVQFLDPGGLSNYSNTQDFTQTFRPVNAGDVIRITFLSFSTESCCDNLAIYDGPTIASPLLQTLAGTALPGSYYSTAPGGELTFKFHSDGSVVSPGWEAIISCIPPPPPPPPDGNNDPTYNRGDIGNPFGASDRVLAMAIQTDGKIVIGGLFTSFNGTAVNRIARLNSNGTLDGTYNVGTGADGLIWTVALQADGKVIIGGEFTSINGVSRKGIARLNTDGTLDASFIVGTGFNDQVSRVKIQTDGKVVVGGSFGTYNGATVNQIVRLNSDGTLDTAFGSGTGTGPNNSVYSLALQTDGKVILGGLFGSFNGTPRNRLARLNTNGTLDTSFDTSAGASDQVRDITVQADNKILIGGRFTTYAGVGRNRIARVNTDGSLDSSFDPGSGFDDQVETIAIQSDGKIVIGGVIQSFNGIPKFGIVRLNSDGTLDAAFNTGTGTSNTVDICSIQPDGKVLIGGGFTQYNSITRNRIARLNTDGTNDGTFNAGSGTGANNLVRAIQTLPDMKILLGGAFSFYNGVPRNGIVRLDQDGNLDPLFNPGSGANGAVRSIAVQPDGKLVIGGDFTSYNGTPRNYLARLNADGSLDISFNIGTGANGIIYSVYLQPDGKIVAGGDFFTFNATSRGRIVRVNSDGSLDATFNPGTGTNGSVFTCTPQQDGKVVISGSFSSFNGTSRNNIARLNIDGSLDTGFNPGSGTNDWIRTHLIQLDGKIFIGGDFSSYNGTGRVRVARINTDGTNDASFNPGTGASNSPVLTSSLQLDGKIIIGGDFLSYNGITRRYIGRINSDGSLDNVFNPGTGGNSWIRTSKIQLDGKILIGGDFTNYGGVIRTRAARVIGAPVNLIPVVTNAQGCVGNSTALTASGHFGAQQYRWYAAASGGSPLGTAATFNTPVLSAATSYYVCFFNPIENQEGQRAEVVVSLTSTPAAPTVESSNQVCEGSSATLTMGGGSNGEYRWYTVAIGGTAIVGQVNATYVTPIIATPTTYYISLNSGACDGPRTPLSLELRNCSLLPVIAAATLRLQISGSAKLDLNSITTAAGAPLDPSSWQITAQPTSGATATIANGILSVDFIGLFFTGTDRITLSVCDQAGNCTSGDVVLEVSGDLVLYNAVSANGDGKNEIFFIENIDLLPDTKENKVTIFNRWGSVVYEATNYSNTANPFRGQGKNGEELPSGTYYYIIEFSSGAPKRTGFISLRR